MRTHLAGHDLGEFVPVINHPSGPLTCDSVPIYASTYAAVIV